MEHSCRRKKRDQAHPAPADSLTECCSGQRAAADECCATGPARERQQLQWLTVHADRLPQQRQRLALSACVRLTVQSNKAEPGPRVRCYTRQLRLHWPQIATWANQCRTAWVWHGATHSLRALQGGSTKPMHPTLGPLLRTGWLPRAPQLLELPRQLHAHQDMQCHKSPELSGPAWPSAHATRSS